MDGTAGRTTSGINNSTDSEQSPLLDRTVNTLKAPASGLRGRLESARNNPHAYISYPANFLYLTYEILVSNYANVFLVFVPLGIVAGALDWDPTWIFILNFLAIVPLAGLLAFATEELAAKLGQTIGGLLNATFGNAVELIVSIIALKEGQIRIVQASMLGSILSNILLVLGCCFIAGGIKRQQQEFDVTVAQTMASVSESQMSSRQLRVTTNNILLAPSSRLRVSHNPRNPLRRNRRRGPARRTPRSHQPRHPPRLPRNQHNPPRPIHPVPLLPTEIAREPLRRRSGQGLPGRHHRRIRHRHRRRRQRIKGRRHPLPRRGRHRASPHHNPRRNLR